MDLLYPNTTYIHSSHLLDDEWAMVRDSGANVSYAPQIELQMGHGWAQAVTALELRRADRSLVGRGDDGAVRPVHADARDLRVGTGRDGTRWPGTQNLEWNEPESELITSRQVLAMATLGGAKVAGIADRAGSITPGKKADIVIIDGRP